MSASEMEIVSGTHPDMRAHVNKAHSRKLSLFSIKSHHDFEISNASKSGSDCRD
jgi:hypothetical protein